MNTISITICNKCGAKYLLHNLTTTKHKCIITYKNYLFHNHNSMSNTEYISGITNIMKSVSINDLTVSNELLETTYKKCIKGYHLINSSSINETVWEDINVMIFHVLGIEVYHQSNGGHLSGMDIDCAIGKLSNKSAKYANNRQSFMISSYRLTTVCSDKHCGTPMQIIEEINRRKNFDYYSFIVRDENSATNTVYYDWLLLPSNASVLEPASYEWFPTIGKRGKNKDEQVGWHTNTINGCKMTISFSMSSQLWIHIEMSEHIKKYIIASTEVSNKPSYNYIDIAYKLTTL